MDVRSFRLSFERAFKHFLRRYIFATIQLDHATIIKRIRIARQHCLSA